MGYPVPTFDKKLMEAGNSACGQVFRQADTHSLVRALGFRHLSQAIKSKQSNKKTLEEMFRIDDILVWIRIRGSKPLTNGSRSCFFVIDLQDANKNQINKKVFLLISF
jgi:hypothetical protein